MDDLNVLTRFLVKVSTNINFIEPNNIIKLLIKAFINLPESLLGLGEHAHFANFGMAFLTLFRVATGDNWNGIMKDTLREDCDSSVDCVRNCCVSTIIAPIFFVVFVLMAQFVLVNVVVAVSINSLIISTTYYYEKNFIIFKKPCYSGI